MQAWKRIVCISLTFCMLTGTIPVYTFAEENTQESIVFDTAEEGNCSQGYTETAPEEMIEDIDQTEDLVNESITDEQEVLIETEESFPQDRKTDQELPEEQLLGESSGSCGEHATWELSDDGVLTISGYGDMSNYYEYVDTNPLRHITFTEVIIDDGITSIGDFAFRYARLKSIQIPDSVTKIGQQAFRGCSSLNEIVISKNVQSIGDMAFYACNNLKCVTFSGNVKSVGAGAFSRTAIDTICFNGTVEQWLNISYADTEALPNQKNCNVYFNGALLTDLVIPGSVGSIRENAFAGVKNIRTVTILPGIASIGKYAFVNCSGMETVDIPSGVTTIGDSAFKGCMKLNKVDIPGGVTAIGASAFEGCACMTEVTMPESLTSIGEKAFYYCTGLTAVSMYGRVTDIGGNVFGSCIKLTDLHFHGTIEQWLAFASLAEKKGESLPNYYAKNIDFDGKVLKNITIPSISGKIGRTTFNNFSGLTSVTVSDGVTTIGDYAFANCPDLVSVEIGKDVSLIGSYAFQNCSSLKNINIPYGVTDLSNTFWGCTGLESITIPNSVTKLYYTFYECRSLKRVTLPEQITEIGDLTFYYCTSLEKITIPENVSAISRDAFFECTSLKMITLPHSLKTIGTYAFKNCTGLRIVSYSGTDEEWSSISIGTDNNELKNARSLTNYQWRFLNSYSSFYGPSGYYISKEDYQRLLAPLSPTNRDSVVFSMEKIDSWDKFLKKPSGSNAFKTNFNVNGSQLRGSHISWSGSCYGMTVWSLLASEGVLKASDIYGSSRTTLHDFFKDDRTASAINFYQMQQMIQTGWSLKTLGLYRTRGEFFDYINKKIIDDLQTLKIGYVYYRLNSEGELDQEAEMVSHAVYAYSVEKGNWNSQSFREMCTANNRTDIPEAFLNRISAYTFTKRIRIYDPSAKDTGLQHFYITDDFKFCCPEYGLLAASDSSKESEVNNWTITDVSDAEMANFVDYKTGVISNINQELDPASVNTAFVRYLGNAGYRVTSKAGTAYIKGTRVLENTYPWVNALPVRSDAVETFGPMEYVAAFPKDSTYTLSTTEGEHLFKLELGDKLITVDAEGSGKAVVSASGKVEVYNNSPCSTYIRITDNKGVLKEAPSVEIIAEDVKDLVVEEKNGKLDIRSKDLGTVYISSTDFETTEQIWLNTTEDRLEVSDQSGLLAVYKDSNKDGKYEEKIADSNENDVPITGCSHSWNTGVVTKAATTTATGIRTYTCKLCGKTKTETIPRLQGSGTGGSTSSTQVMYRLYNPNSGEHFYTANKGEKDYLVRIGWSYEGIGWTAPKTSKTPVYRLYNPNSGDHHYTTNKGEKDMLVRVGWNYEQIGWYSDDQKGVPLYRQYNPNCKGAGSHNYTTSKGENDYLVRLGWNAEGIGWYGMK